MNFGIAYTKEQEAFRKEVRAWLDANIPENMRTPIDYDKDFTPEMNTFWRKLHMELGHKGWLYPTYPKEYGGGGLTADHAAILDEEFERARVRSTGGSNLTANVLLVWATEEQKQKFLVPLLKGEKTEHMRMTEPHSGADLADYRSRAVKEGDEWVVNGENVFISAYGDEDFLPGPLLTDPNAPRHRNLGYFVIPNPTPGLLVKPMDLLVGHGQKQVYMTNVRLPADHLIGGETQGWQVHATHLEIEHGGGGRAGGKDKIVESLVEYARTKKADGQTVGADSVAAQVVADAVLEAHVYDLLGKKTYWMYQSRMPVQYEGNVADVHHRYGTLRNAVRVRDVAKMDALLGAHDERAPFGGRFEVDQRSCAGQHHAGGSSNIAKVILARRIGISRTKERAAPTPSTVAGISAPGA
jgi:alkylation response protein AidB-like acyl-CoA dehydrogenase